MTWAQSGGRLGKRWSRKQPDRPAPLSPTEGYPGLARRRLHSAVQLIVVREGGLGGARPEQQGGPAEKCHKS